MDERRYVDRGKGGCITCRIFSKVKTFRINAAIGSHRGDSNLEHFISKGLNAI